MKALPLHQITFRVQKRTVHILQARGVGLFGALGLGNFEDELHFKTVPMSSPVKKVAAGFGHTAMITADNNLAICGRGFDLGSLFKSYSIYRVLPFFAVWAAKITLADKETDVDEIILQPRVFTELNKYKVIHISASGGLTLALTENGRLFPIGANIFGQCGLGIDKNRVWKPVASASVPPVLLCDTGLQHCIVLCEGGGVYCWGKGKNGQMGNGQEDETNSFPIKVDLPQKCVSVASGLNHCAAVGVDGTVYLWGRRMSLELEDERQQTYKDQLLPREFSLSDDLKATQVYCSSFGTVLVTSDGTLWAMGVDETANRVYTSPLPVLCPFDYDAYPDKSDEELGNLPEFNRPYVLDPEDVLRKGYYAVSMISSCREKVLEVVISNGVARLQEIVLEPRAPGKIVDFSTGFRHTLIVVDAVGEEESDDNISVEQ